MHSERNGSVELARFVSSIGIVWFHEQVPGGPFGLAGLSAFMVFVVFYAAGNTLHIWLVWSALYLCANLADVLLSRQTFPEKFYWWMLLTGPAIHLWFLPFAYVVCRIVKKGPKAIAVLACLMVFCLMADIKTVPFAQYASVLPAAMFGVALSAFPHHMTLVSTIGLAGLLLTGNIAWILGCGLAAVSLVYPLPTTPLMTILGRIALPIYLIHPAISAAAKQFGLLAWDKAIVVVLVSIVVSIALDRSPIKRYLALR